MRFFKLTLIEWMVVVAIFMVLIAMLLPAYQSARRFGAIPYNIGDSVKITLNDKTGVITRIYVDEAEVTYVDDAKRINNVKLPYSQLKRWRP